jgi:hypothetical protein
MAWITPTIAGISAVAGLAGQALNSGRSNAQQTGNQALQYQALQDARDNSANQSLVQALINQRSVAGTQDPYGGGTRYDPATNTWINTQGKLPAAANTAAMQAAISRNTTDLRGAQFANEQEALRASRAAPAADAAQRELASFRPMGGDQLTGLLTNQATLAANNTFNPLIADTLRNFARTGTAAGPVLGQIGRDQATNLRQSLIDAQIKGMTSVDQINQGRRQALEQTAANTATLAHPQLQYSGISPSGVDTTMAQVVGQRAAAAGQAPAYGMAGMNLASKQVEDAYGVAGKSIADPNFNINKTTALTDALKTATGPGGGIRDFVNYLTSGSGNKGDLSSYGQNASDYQTAPGFGIGDATVDPNSYWQ